MLQTREGSKALQGESVLRAQITKRGFLLKHLPQYRVRWNSSAVLRNGYRFYWFEHAGRPLPSRVKWATENAAGGDFSRPTLGMTTHPCSNMLADA